MTDELFNSTYEKYRNSVYSVIFNYLRSEASSKDIMQETFIKFYTCDSDFNDDEHIKAWLIRVAVNLCKNHLRDEKRRSGGELDENTAAPQNFDFSDIMTAVLALPEKYRLPIHLFYYEDYSVKQIADVLSVSESVVKTRLSRGRSKLKKKLEKEGGHYEYQIGL